MLAVFGIDPASIHEEIAHEAVTGEEELEEVQA